MAARLLHGKGKIWPEITRSVSRRRQNQVACAFIAKGAYALLPLRRGDTLVVDMSSWRVSSGATDPKAVSEFLREGVKVYTCDGLHAKLFVLGSRLVVGSTNLSQSSSQFLDEAALVVTDGALVQAGRDFIEQIVNQANTTSVDSAMIRRLTPRFRERGWHTGTSNGRPGADWPLAMLREIAPASVRIGRWGPFIELSQPGGIKQVYLHSSADKMQLGLYPANTAEQAQRLYGSLDIRQAVQLQTRGWKIRPAFHLGFRDRNFRNTHASALMQPARYLSLWKYPPSDLEFRSARMPTEYAGLVKTLRRRHLATQREIRDLRRDIANRPWVTLRPGFELLYSWNGRKPTADQVVQQINLALRTWKEKFEVRGSGSRRYATIESFGQ